MTSVRVTANQTGRWRAVLDFTDARGETVTVAVSEDDQVLDEGTFTVQPPAEDGATDGGSGDGDGPSDGTGAGDGGGDVPAVGGGGSFIPGVLNLVLFGIGFLAVIVLLILWRR